MYFGKIQLLSIISININGFFIYQIYFLKNNQDTKLI